MSSVGWQRQRQQRQRRRHRDAPDDYAASDAGTITTTAATWRTRVAADGDGADESGAGKDAGERETTGPAGWSSEPSSSNRDAASVLNAAADGDGDAAVDDGVDAGAASAPADAVADVAAAPRPRTARGRTPSPHSSSPEDDEKKDYFMSCIFFFMTRFWRWRGREADFRKI